ncbi:phage portal protein [Streptomyces sp. DSM 44917]|uniref:Phage portal protein n=1 Tax=Streptomyces boetiae TaxID=3075541 RepID=A0ABU2L469_9ACTN|nr:phage portal protein [Streptomyces sp. DSM 44917]MDT0306118.1 phage portal protein [Streptomyces sp. DSM 44917]
MPLPPKDTPWPPIAPRVRCALEDWAAWYSADPDQIAARYLNRPVFSGRPGQAPQNRPSQYRGGLVGALARMFWGEPTPLGEKRTKLHVPLASDIARTSADLLFSEPPTLAVDSADTQERLEQILTGGLRRTLLTGGELAAALGGSYLRLVWDAEVTPGPWITAVGADGAIPDLRNGRLAGATFWRVLGCDGPKVVRFLERHEKGAILHGVYEGTEDNLGRPIDLGAFPETKTLNAVEEFDIGPRLTVALVPNTMTARSWRDVPGTLGLGESDYQGSETLLDALDETMTAWMRDVRLAKARLTVPEGYLRANGPGRGVSWEDREVFVPLNVPPTEGNASGLTLHQAEIRFAEHKATAEELAARIIRNAGYSSGTFGDDSDGPAATATEIKARQARSMSTRARKAELWAVGIADIVEAQLALEATRFPGVAGVEVERPAVQFKDSVQDDIKTLAETAALLRQAEAASTATLVALVNPGMDADDQAAEVQRILAESGRAVADPVTAGRGDDDAGPAEPEDGAPEE